METAEAALASPFGQQSSHSGHGLGQDQRAAWRNAPPPPLTRSLLTTYHVVEIQRGAVHTRDDRSSRKDFEKRVASRAGTPACRSEDQG